MISLKTLPIALLAMIVLSLTATSALALPDVSITLGGEYPLAAHFANGNTSVELQSTGGGKLEGKGLSLSGSIVELSALGMAELEILNVKNGSSGCHSTGDKEGVVLVKDTLDLVPIKLTPLEIGVLHTGQEVTIECGLITIKVRGAVIDTLNAGEGELTEVGSRLEGSKGKNNLTKYFNDKGVEVKAILESNFETGFKQSAVTVGEEIKISVLEKKMFEITGR